MLCLWCKKTIDRAIELQNDERFYQFGIYGIVEVEQNLCRVETNSRFVLETCMHRKIMLQP